MNRNSLDGRYIIILAFLALYVVGCAASPYKESYDIAIKDKRYGDAYKMLKELCATTPGDHLCSEMKKVGEIYSAEKIAALESSLKNAARPIPLKTIDNLNNDLKEIIGINPSAVNIGKIKSSLEAEEKTTKTSAAKAVKDAEAALLSNNYRDANDRYKFASELDATYKKDYDEFAKTSVNKLLVIASEAKNKDDWRAAAPAYEDAYYIDPTNPDAASGVDESKEKNTLEYFIKLGDASSDAEKYDEAITYYTYASGYPSSDAAKAKIGTVRINAASKYFSDAEELLESGSPLSAAISISNAVVKYNQIPKNNKSAVKVPSAKITRLLNDLFSKAKASADEKDYTLAYFYSTMISRIQPDYPDLASFRDKIRDEVKRRALTTIAVIPFKGPSVNPGAGNSITSRIMDFLYKEMSTDVKILERGAMESLLKEGEVKALQGGEMNESIMKLLNADFFLLGDISHYNIDTSTNESTKTVRGKVGTNKIKNYAYDEWLVKKKGEQPPMYKDEPVYENVKYKVTHHKKSAFISVGFRIVNANGDVVNTGVVEKKKAVADDSSEGIDIGEFKVESKLASIPSDSELLMTVENEAMQELGANLKTMFGNRDTQLIAEAEKFKEKGNYKASIDRLIKAYFVAQKKNVSTEKIEDATMGIVLDGKL